MVTRHELTFTILLVLIILSVVPSIHQTNATDASPDLGAKLFPDFVQVSVNLHVFQNLTQLEPTFTFPQYNATLSGDNSTTMASDLQTAIRNQAPQATVTDLTLQLVSTSASNSAQSQWFNVSFQFHMGGVQTVQNGIQRVDLGWKSFNVPQNVSVGHVEINNIGQSYLYQPAIAIAALERSGSGSVVSYSNIVNYFRVTPPNLASRTVRINLLNFTQLLSPVDTWQEKYDYSTGTVNWSFRLNQILGLMVITTSTEPQEVPIKNGAIYTIEAAVSAPARSWAQGNTVNAVFDDNSETLMTLIIATGVVILAATIIIERRVLKSSVRRTKNR